MLTAPHTPHENAQPHKNVKRLRKTEEDTNLRV